MWTVESNYAIAIATTSIGLKISRQFSLHGHWSLSQALCGNAKQFKEIGFVIAFKNNRGVVIIELFDPLRLCM